MTPHLAAPLRARRPGGLRAACVALLVACLLLAQALAFVHRVVHVRAPELAQASASAHEGASELARLFAGHADDAGCRLFDVLGHGGPPVASPPALPMALAATFLPAAPSGCLPARTEAFLARGPPAHD